MLLCLLALHPAWTVSALTGDCGFQKRSAFWFFTALGTVALGSQVGRFVWTRVHPNVGLSEEWLRANLERLSEQQRDAIRRLASSGRTGEAIHEVERILGISLGSGPSVADREDRRRAALTLPHQG